MPGPVLSDCRSPTAAPGWWPAVRPGYRRATSRPGGRSERQPLLVGVEGVRPDGLAQLGHLDLVDEVDGGPLGARAEAGEGGRDEADVAAPQVAHRDGLRAHRPDVQLLVHGEVARSRVEEVLELERV